MTREQSGQPASPPAGSAGRKSWTEPSTIVAIVALLVSLGALYLSWDAAQSGRTAAEVSRREADRASVLEISAVDATLAQDLTGTSVPLENTEKARQLKGLRGPKIDLTLKNRGSGEALIDSATITVHRSETLAACHGLGGVEGVAANYDFPVDPRATTPFSITKEMRFTVPSAEHERLTLTVGPTGKYVGEDPWIGVLQVTLHHAGGQDIEFGPVAVVSPGTNGNFMPGKRGWVVKPPKDKGCMRSNATLVTAVLGLDNVRASRELLWLDRALEPFRAG